MKKKAAKSKPRTKRTTAKPRGVVVHRLAMPLLMWAIIIRSARAEWIHWGTIDRTRGGAIAKYRDQWSVAGVTKDHIATGRIRAAKVRVMLA